MTAHPMTILLATDGSETAEAAVEYAAVFPFPAGSRFVVLTVLRDVLREHEIDSLTPEQWDTFNSEHQDHRDEAADVLEATAGRLADAGWEVSTETRTGHAASEIVDAAGEHAADVVVVGSHGLGGFRRFLLGSVSNQVLHSAKCSVMIVRRAEEDCDGKDPIPPSADGHQWRILLGYDGSPSSDKAVRFLENLSLISATEVHLVTVLPMVKMFRQDIRQEMNWIWQQKRDADRSRLDEVADRLRPQSGEVTTELVEAGDVSEAILEAGEQFEADLIVLGHKGKGAIEKFLMGSVTPRIAHHTCRSLLAVR